MNRVLKIFLVFSVLIFFLGLTSLSLPAKLSAESVTQPILNAKFYGISEQDGRLFILNGDASVSIYDPSREQFVISRKKMTGITVPTGIYVSPKGAYFAIVSSFPPTYANVAFFKTDDFINKPNPSPHLIYSLDSWGIFRALFSQNESKFYVVSGNKNHIWSLNSREYLEKTLDLGKPTSNLAESGDGKKLFLVHQGTNEVSVVDLAQWQRTKTLKTEAKPLDLVFDNQKNTLYVSNSGKGSVTSYDLSTNLQQSISIGSTAGYMALDDKSRTLYVADDVNGAISLINITDFKLLKKLSFPGVAYQHYSPISLAFNQKMERLVVLNMTSQKYFIYSPTAGQVIKEGLFPLLPFDIISADASPFVFIGSRDGAQILKLDASSNAQLIPSSSNENESFLSAPFQFRLDIPNNRVFVGNLGSGRISVIDVQNSKPITSFPAITNPYIVLLNSKTQKLYVGSPSENKVVVFDVSKKNFPLLKTIPIGVLVQSASLSESRNEIYLSNVGDKSISIIDGNTDSVVATVPWPDSAKHVYTGPIYENRMYLHDISGNRIYLLDLAQRKIVDSIVVKPKPWVLLTLPSLGQLYVGSGADKAVEILDLKTNKIIQTLAVKGITNDLISVDSLVYLGYQENETVSVIKPSKEGEAKIIANKIIAFFGEEGTKYNKLRYYASQKMAITSDKRGSRILFAVNQPDDKKIMRLNWLWTMNADGSITRSSSTPQSAPVTSSSEKQPFYYIMAIMLFGALVILVFWYSRRRQLFHKL